MVMLLELCHLHQILFWIVLSVEVTISFFIHRRWQFPTKGRKRTRRGQKKQSLKTKRKSLQLIQILKTSPQYIGAEDAVESICNISDEAIEQSRGKGGKHNYSLKLFLIKLEKKFKLLRSKIK